MKMFDFLIFVISKMFSKDFENYKLALLQYSEQTLLSKQRSQAFFESNLVYQKLLTKMVIGLCNKTNILYIGRLENVRYQDLISPDRKLFDVYDYVSKRHVYFEGLIYEYSDCKLKSLTQLPDNQRNCLLLNKCNDLDGVKITAPNISYEQYLSMLEDSTFFNDANYEKVMV